MFLRFSSPVCYPKLLLHTLVRSNKRIHFLQIIFLINLIISSYFFENLAKNKKRSDFSVSLHIFSNGAGDRNRTCTPGNQILSLARLPVPPHPHVHISLRNKNYTNNLLKSQPKKNIFLIVIKLDKLS